LGGCPFPRVSGGACACILSSGVLYAILVSMTKKKKRKGRKVRRVLKREATTGRWVLHEAKARFSEVVRQANTVGPQHVTVHGRNEVVIMSAEEYARLKGERSGRLLVDLMRKSPLRDIEIEPAAEPSPVRDVDL